MIYLDEADAFFNHHLLSVEYFAFDEELRLSALRMAECDIAAELGHAPDADNPLELSAVCEQSVFLLRNRGDDRSSQIVSESVDGVGSRSYQASDLPGIAPRARRYLRALLGATVEIVRG